MTRKQMFSVGGSDLTWQFFHAGGSGGSNQNKTSTGVRVIHKASGATGEARDTRSQLDNRKLALKRLADSVKFRQWVALRHAEIERGETVEQEVARGLSPSNLKLEVRNEEGKWIDVAV